MIAVLVISILCSFQAKAQSYEAQQLLLDWEKLMQLKEILSHLYKGYDILSKGYTAVKDISEGSFDLHKDFLDGLLEVSPLVKNYKRVGDIMYAQTLILKTSKRALAGFSSSDLFSKDEIGYMQTVYTNLIEETTAANIGYQHAGI